MSRHVMSRHVTSCRVTSCRVMSRHVASCHVMSRYVALCHVISRHFTSCHVMSRHVTSCHVLSRHIMSHHVASRCVMSLQAVSEALTSDDSVRNLGVLVDSELKFHEHISKMSQNCFFQLRRMRSIRCSISRKAMLTLAHAFICSRVDFCNILFFGVSSYLLGGLQSIMNATARLILNIPKFGHISEEIRTNLHWLPVRQRINYKVCYLVRNCLAGAAPEYLSEVCQSTSQHRSSTPPLCTSQRPSGASREDSELRCQRIFCFWT